MRFAPFVVVVAALTALAWTLVGAFVVPMLPGGWATLFLAWGAAVVPLFVLVRHLATGRYPSAFTRRWVFRSFWYAQLLMLALAFIAGIAGLLGAPFGAADVTGRVAILGATPILVLLGIWGYAGSRRLVVREVQLSPRALPRELDGLRVVQLSDLHVGPQTRVTQLERIARAARDARADLLVFTGDQVDDHPADIDVFARAFGALSAPLGVYAIPGNHDVYAGWSDVRRRMQAAGFTVLVNDAVELEYRGARFWLAGTGDPSGQHFARGPESAAPDVDRTMAPIGDGRFSLVLAHDPRLFPALAARGAGVVLSGHTHHGQLSVPALHWSLASVFLDYAMGTYERDGSLLYISPGTNYWGIPFRIGALPEVSVIVLRASPAAA